ARRYVQTGTMSFTAVGGERGDGAVLDGIDSFDKSLRANKTRSSSRARTSRTDSTAGLVLHPPSAPLCPAHIRDTPPSTQGNHITWSRWFKITPQVGSRMWNCQSTSRLTAHWN